MYDIHTFYILPQNDWKRQSNSLKLWIIWKRFGRVFGEEKSKYEPHRRHKRRSIAIAVEPSVVTLVANTGTCNYNWKA